MRNFAGTPVSNYIKKLRKKHPRFIYDRYYVDQKDEKLQIRFNFVLEPNIVFNPEITIPQGCSLETEEFENFVFHLGLIEMLSYWKAACPKEIKIEAGKLEEEQVKWWHDLFIYGLGQFFYENNIDFTSPDFLQINSSAGKKPISPFHNHPKLSGNLILVGGGKDSSVTLELLKKLPGRKQTLILNPIRSAIESARIAGYPEPLVVKRTIDENLLELNRQGYLNGHTPFSAYLAFLGVFVGVLHCYKNIIVSNDRSADEENIIFHGMPVNHQYSKSTRFERLFRAYCRKYLNPYVQYFSFLRPLYEVQISQLFANLPEEHHFSFRSCNVGQKEDKWCGGCAKCAFIYMSLFPFLPQDKIEKIFGSDYFLKPEIGRLIRRLVGLEEYKPFECVGTKEESILLVALAIRKYRDTGRELPPVLVSLEKELGLNDTKTIRLLEKKIKNGWNNENFLPPEYTKVLKEALTNL